MARLTSIFLMQWFSMLEWATWPMLILVYSKPVIWCSVLETVLELEMWNHTLFPKQYICPFHFLAGAVYVKSLAGVVCEFYAHSRFLFSSPRLFPMSSSICWISSILLNETALLSRTAGRRFPRYRWSASRLHLSVLRSAGQLSAHARPLSHPPLWRDFVRGHPMSSQLYESALRQRADVW